MPDDPISDKDKALFRYAIEKLDRGLASKEQEEKYSIKNFKKNSKNSLSHIESWKSTQSNMRSGASSQIKNNLSYSPIYLSDHYYETVKSDSVLSYSHPSLSSKRFQEFLKGNVRWEAKLDLHGLNLDLAKDRLIDFILNQNLLGHRVILVVHGKGGQFNPTPVLKNLVKHWLPQFPQVLAFRSAIGRDGGNGAVYVLLKNNR